MRRALEDEDRVLKVFMFSSARKMSSVLMRPGRAHGQAGGDGDGARLHVKGASEMVLTKCTHALLGGESQPTPLTDELRAELGREEGLEERSEELRSEELRSEELRASLLPDPTDTGKTVHLAFSIFCSKAS